MAQQNREIDKQDSGGVAFASPARFVYLDAASGAGCFMAVFFSGSSGGSIKSRESAAKQQQLALSLPARAYMKKRK